LERITLILTLVTNEALQELGAPAHLGPVLAAEKQTLIQMKADIAPQSICWPKRANATGMRGIKTVHWTENRDIAFVEARDHRMIPFNR